MQYDKFLLVLLLVLTSCQEQISVSIPSQTAAPLSTVKNRISKKLLKLRPNEGLVYYKDEPFTGIAEQKYPNGNLATSSQFVKGKKHGEFRKWFDNNILSFESYYKNGKREGITRSWWRNGNLRSESTFQNGIAQGVHMEWYKSGAKFKKINLVDGKEEGLQQAWRENGKIFNNYEAKNGRIFGLKRANLCFELDNEEVQFSD